MLGGVFFERSIDVNEVEGKMDRCRYERGTPKRRVDVVDVVVPPEVVNLFCSPCQRGGRNDVGEGEELFHGTKQLSQK